MIGCGVSWQGWQWPFCWHTIEPYTSSWGPCLKGYMTSTFTNYKPMPSSYTRHQIKSLLCTCHGGHMYDIIEPFIWISITQKVPRFRLRAHTSFCEMSLGNLVVILLIVFDVDWSHCQIIFISPHRLIRLKLGCVIRFWILSSCRSMI